MNISESARAVCPFYRTYSGRVIQCESCVKKARLTFAFKTQEAALRHKRAFCDTFTWAACPYAAHMDREEGR